MIPDAVARSVIREALANTPESIAYPQAVEVAAGSNGLGRGLA